MDTAVAIYKINAFLNMMTKITAYKIDTHFT